MKIGNDFSDQLMLTEDKSGQDGVNDSDEDGKTYEIKDDPSQETGFDSGNRVMNHGTDQAFLGTQEGQGNSNDITSQLVEQSNSSITTSTGVNEAAGADNNSGTSTLTSQTSPEKQEEI